ncbi:YncE family protein [Phycicoccus sp. SLBN-51]|jgi:YVTN family beta-propeller protein|uniref:YncE family protein n=1 Tax=Phycicoccus sp. SLBN-51 TaxID=2768447 RepID=UPI001153DE62|nr:YncE family protein [Phycicoccus sp. SLBN-51]TQJ51821.1 YVTN family beta-propeller protein [Phycicoccus sp. SLBN-51]
MHPGGTRGRVALILLSTVLAAAGCSTDATSTGSAGGTPSSTGSGPAPSSPASATGSASPTTNVYAADAAGALTGAARTAKPMVYVPNTISDTVQLIDPSTYKVVGRFPTGREPQHVVPSWDMKTLWVNDDLGNDLIPIDPKTGKAGKRVPVEDPYNLYFTPDGKHALVMAERLRRIDVRNPHTMKLQRSLSVPCHGVNHADYSADASFFVASCEFSGKLLVIDADATKVRKVIDLNKVKTPGATSPHDAMMMPGSPKQGLMPGASAMPQDVRLTPDGRYFLAADMLRNGVWVIDARTLTITRFIHTAMGAHGIYPSRDAGRLFVSNRDAGSITVLDSATLKKVALWEIPGGGSPDMGGVSSDGSELWLAGRYDHVVYVFDTTTGKVTHRIKVDSGPHGLAVWPQPGRFSLGHTGNMR